MAVYLLKIISEKAGFPETDSNLSIKKSITGP